MQPNERDLARRYQGLADPVRLRILNLLLQGPLCVCHIQALVRQAQAKTSKQLAFLKQRGWVSASRLANWTIYRISESADPPMRANLEVIRETRTSQFDTDLRRRERLVHSLQCCEETAPRLLAAGIITRTQQRHSAISQKSTSHPARNQTNTDAKPSRTRQDPSRRPRAVR